MIGVFRFLTWCCVLLIAVLSLLPAEEMLRTGLPGQLEHGVAYAGATGIAMLGYGLERCGPHIIAGFAAYSGVLELLQHFSPGRHPQWIDFAVSSLGVLCGGVAIILLRSRIAAVLPQRPPRSRRLT